MIDSLSDEENIRILVEQFNMSEERGAFIVAMERGETRGDLQVTDGLLSAEQRRRLGLGRQIDEDTE